MPDGYENRMLRVLDYIHANPAGDLSLDALADVAAMSRFHWHRVFHAMTGETCAQAVRRIRLYRAAEWLTGTDLPAAEIARRVGYPSVQSFGRAFRAGFGLPPVRFREIGAPYAPQLLKREIPLQTYDVVIETAPDRLLAALAHRGPYPTLGATFEKLSAIATARGLWPQVTDRVGVFLDDPAVVSARDLRSFAGLALRDQAALPDDLEPVEIPGGPVARLRHHGPFSGLHAAYGYFFGVWLPQSGREPADQPVHEIYVKTPPEATPEDLVTDICLRLKP